MLPEVSFQAYLEEFAQAVLLAASQVEPWVADASKAEPEPGVGAT